MKYDKNFKPRNHNKGASLNRVANRGGWGICQMIILLYIPTLWSKSGHLPESREEGSKIKKNGHGI